MNDMTVEAIEETYESEVLCLDDETEPGVYLCQDDALQLAELLERAATFMPTAHLTGVKLARLLRSCAGDGVEALYAKVDV